MHMADALISPTVGMTMWAVTGGLIAHSSRKIREESDERKTPLMGVLGAFIFAAQMINFSIPATGSSGHLGGGMILAILLGPYAAFIVLASVITVQALFFADGGFLSLGCNIFNLGFFPCFVVYPFIYKNILGNKLIQKRISIGSFVSAVTALQLGAISVVLQTVFSGIAQLPMQSFLVVMLPIHFAIGCVEGLITAGVIIFILKSRPEILTVSSLKRTDPVSIKKVFLGILAAAIIIGGFFSWFASSKPDGLEWSISKMSGKEELKIPEIKIYSVLSAIQEKISFLPEYAFRKPKKDMAEANVWPAVDAGTSLSGIVGGTITFVVVLFTGIFLRKNRKAFV